MSTNKTEKQNDELKQTQSVLRSHLFHIKVDPNFSTVDYHTICTTSHCTQVMNCSLHWSITWQNHTLLHFHRECTDCMTLCYKKLIEVSFSFGRCLCRCICIPYMMTLCMIPMQCTSVWACEECTVTARYIVLCDDTGQRWCGPWARPSCPPVWSTLWTGLSCIAGSNRCATSERPTILCDKVNLWFL